ncbi:MAG: hypothetical protein KC475_12505 [Cyanobacteria bacterium HKST-UBA03]|nr:hypothetical protein [Cyanobacteria bacterium HKST-UBA03]
MKHTMMVGLQELQQQAHTFTSQDVTQEIQKLQMEQTTVSSTDPAYIAHGHRISMLRLLQASMTPGQSYQGDFYTTESLNTIRQGPNGATNAQLAELHMNAVNLEPGSALYEQTMQQINALERPSNPFSALNSMFFGNTSGGTAVSGQAASPNMAGMLQGLMMLMLFSRMFNRQG